MNFEDFQKKVIDVTNTVGKKTNDLIEEGKLLYKIREAEREIDRLYRTWAAPSMRRTRIWKSVSKNTLRIKRSRLTGRKKSLPSCSGKLAGY